MVTAAYAGALLLIAGIAVVLAGALVLMVPDARGVRAWAGMIFLGALLCGFVLWGVLLGVDMYRGLRDPGPDAVWERTPSDETDKPS